MTNLYEDNDRRDLIPVGIVGFISINEDGTLSLKIDHHTLEDSLNDYFEDDPEIDYAVVAQALKLCARPNEILLSL
jgi:hypothetical protein